MDVSSLAIALGIVLYGAIEYRRREKRQRGNLEWLRKGVEPPTDTGALYPRWRLVTTGIVTIVALAAALVVIVRGATLPRYGGSLIVIGGIFLLLAVAVLLLFMRAGRQRRAGERREVR